MNAELRLTDRKREAIVKAAIAEFSENGFQKTSMDKVSARAEVSKRTVYNHFPSKDLLFEAIIEEMWERCTRSVECQFNPSAPLRDQLLQVAHQEVALQCSEEFRSMVRIYITECIGSPEISEAALQRLSEMDTGLHQWMRDAAEAGQLKPLDPIMATEQFLGLMKPFTFWPQTIANAPTPNQEEIDRVTEASVDMFLAYYQV